MQRFCYLCNQDILVHSDDMMSYLHGMTGKQPNVLPAQHCKILVLHMAVQQTIFHVLQMTVRHVTYLLCCKGAGTCV